MFAIISEDFKQNKGNTKGLFIVLCFRLASACATYAKKNFLFKIFGSVLIGFYKVFIDYLMGVYIPPTTSIGEGFVIYHGVGIVINENTIIGKCCTIRHNVTLGSISNKGNGCPKIGNNVNIGAGAMLLGDISIGDHAVIGAASVVLIDVPPNSTAVGNPARIISPQPSAVVPGVVS